LKIKKLKQTIILQKDHHLKVYSL